MAMKVGKISQDLPKMSMNQSKNERKEDSLKKDDLPKKDDLSKKDIVIKAEEMDNVVSQLNNFLEPVKTNLRFELHDDLDRYYVKVIDQSTDEIVREIPPEEMLDMYASMLQHMGLLIDERIWNIYKEGVIANGNACRRISIGHGNR